MLFGSYEFAAAADLAKEAVRDPSNFHWAILTLFAIVMITYCNEIKAKNYAAVACLGIHPILRRRIQNLRHGSKEADQDCRNSHGNQHPVIGYFSSTGNYLGTSNHNN